MVLALQALHARLELLRRVRSVEGVVSAEGYDAIGHPIPLERLGAAYDAVKDMAGCSTEEAMTLVGRVAGALERDEPYLAMRLATSAPIGRGSAQVLEMAESDRPPVQLDVTGGYRLLAHLLAGGGV